MIKALQETRAYLNYIEEHYYNVQKAWKIIQEKGNGKGFSFLYDDFKFFTLDAEIKKHDLSKLSLEEFIPYRKKFYPCSDKEADGSFAAAWEHHKQHNAHHWENIANGTELNVVHMVCDWMAMGMTHHDSARVYYEKNKKTICLPEWAEKLIYEIFDLVEG